MISLCNERRLLSSNGKKETLPAGATESTNNFKGSLSQNIPSLSHVTFVLSTRLSSILSSSIALWCASSCSNPQTSRRCCSVSQYILAIKKTPVCSPKLCMLAEQPLRSLHVRWHHSFTQRGSTTKI